MSAVSDFVVELARIDGLLLSDPKRSVTIARWDFARRRLRCERKG
jgi:hypothetical protein